MFDIISDVHGCFYELLELLEKLGYKSSCNLYKHPDNRIPVFVGDIIDRGPNSLDVFSFVYNMVNSGLAKLSLGNHDDKLK